ncbi:MAG: translation elongation factor Ts, partial [Arenimonas sp.]|uniref:translation elongation factor Ts n=1 Tax=Arenimonas sp. TaxID=1872635 RepID=UPI003C11CA44
MEITASLVKELRERSGAGMMECKKALTENAGNIDAAMEYLRKTGLAKADKKADRVAAEGRIGMASSGGKAVLVEVNSETDFVAKDDNFLSFVNAVAEAALASDAADAEALKSVAMNGGTVEEARAALIAKVGENVQVRRLVRVNSPNTVAAYIHGGRIGVLVDLAGGDMELARGIAMHVPFVDALTTMLDESIPLTTNEWTQWGNPVESKEAYDYIRSYAPYDNLEAKPYPAMLV